MITKEDVHDNRAKMLAAGELVDAGDFFYCRIRVSKGAKWEYQTCTFCEKRVEIDKKSLLPNHHCPSATVAARHGHDTGESGVRTPSQRERLKTGFSMMRDDDEYLDDATVRRPSGRIWES